MKNKIKRLGLLALLAAVFSASNAYATTYFGKATASIAEGSSGMGTVYASKSKSTPSSGWTTESSAQASDTSKTLNVYLYAKANSGCTFSGWATSSTATTASDTANPKTVSGTGTEKTPADFGTFYAVFSIATYYGKAEAGVSSACAGGTVSVSTSSTAGSYGTSASVDFNSTPGVGVASASQTVYYFASAKTGYEFVGWSTSSSGTTATYTGSPYSTSCSYSSTASDSPTTTKLYAVFKAKTYYGKAEAGVSSACAGGTVSVSTSSTADSYSMSASVTYNSAPGSSSASQTVYYFAQANAGYEFVGWSTSPSGTTADYTGNPYSVDCTCTSTSSGSPTVATKLYAVFKMKTYYGKAEAGVYGEAGMYKPYAGTGTVSVNTTSTPGTYGQSANVEFNSAPGSASATQSVFFFAQPDAGYEFVGWSKFRPDTGDEPTIESTANPYTVSVTYSSENSASPSSTRKLAFFRKLPDYLSFTAVDGSVTVGMTNAVVSLEYAASKSGPWTAIDFAGGATLTIPSGTTYYFRSTLATPPTPNSKFGIGQFTMTGTGKIDAGGEVTSLIDATCAKTNVANYEYKSLFKGCTNLRSAPALPATTPVDSCYAYMFSGCTSLTTAPALPATTVAEYCYDNMFSDCTSLTTAPALPATTVAEYCYRDMFRNCTSLTTAPALPATTMAKRCYYSMFSGCTSLTTAPALPATTLAMYCYGFMFSNCKSLTAAPELPVTELESYCYYYMFNNCSKLNSVKVNFTDWAADQSATDNWLPNNVGTFVCPAALDLSTRTADTVPPKWNVGWDVGGAGSNVFASKDTTGTLTISGEGTIGSGKFTDAVKSQITSLVIGQGVTGAAPDAFAGMTLSNVTLPTSWTGVQYDGSGNWYGAQLPQTEVTLLSVAQRYPWNNIVDYTYSIENLIPTMTYKLVVALTVDGETKATTNDVTTTADGTYTKQLDLSSLFEDGAKDSAAKIKLSLIK